MRTAIVSSKQLMIFGRWDAGFNIWAHQLINGLETGNREAFWIWFDSTKLKSSELFRVLVESNDLDDAVINFMRYMQVRSLYDIDKMIPNWKERTRQFVQGLVEDIIAKKQAEVDHAVLDMAQLRNKFKITCLKKK
jgi:hypothetical protein